VLLERFISFTAALLSSCLQEGLADLGDTSAFFRSDHLGDFPIVRFLMDPRKKGCQSSVEANQNLSLAQQSVEFKQSSS
jgi:hypothetical protein